MERWLPLAMYINDAFLVFLLSEYRATITTITLSTHHTSAGAQACARVKCHCVCVRMHACMREKHYHMIHVLRICLQILNSTIVLTHTKI